MGIIALEAVRAAGYWSGRYRTLFSLVQETSTPTPGHRNGTNSHVGFIRHSCDVLVEARITRLGLDDHPRGRFIRQRARACGSGVAERNYAAICCSTLELHRRGSCILVRLVLFWSRCSMVVEARVTWLGNQ